MRYDYKESVKQAVKDWIIDELNSGLSSKEDIDFEYVYEACYVQDSVTGNASGSYTFSRYEARNNFFEDENSEEYLDEMISDGIITREELGRHMAESDWEWIDVCIRCNLLFWAVDAAIKEMDF